MKSQWVCITLLLFTLVGSAAAINVVLYDMTDGYTPYIQIYQNDNNSDNYIKSENIEGNGTDLEPFTLGEGLGYTIQLEAEYHTALKNVHDDEFVSYWFDYIRYYGFGFILIFIMVIILWRYYWKGY